MTISMPRPPHRLERLRAWMDDEKVDCTVVFGADNVNHLCGYWRYFGGPSALVIGRDGERTLVVMRGRGTDRRQRRRTPTQVLGYGERGFGIDLDPVADARRDRRRRSRRRRGEPHRRLLGAPGRRGPARARSCPATVVDAGGALHRIRLIKDWDELEKINAGYELCWLGQEAVARRRRRRA